MRVVSISPLAGKPAPASMLVDIPKLVTAYYAEQPDPAAAAERVAFGTSGHRGSSFKRTFNERHILAITQAICRYRRAHQISGPLFLGMDTHALSEPAFVSALEVLAGNGVDVMIDRDRGYTPTPVISHAGPTDGRTASSSRRPTTRPRTADSSTTRRTAVPRKGPSRRGSRAPRTRCSRTTCAGWSGSPTRARARRPARTGTTTSVPMWTASAASSTPTRSAAPA
jgi:hypothetical protein